VLFTGQKMCAAVCGSCVELSCRTATATSDRSTSPTFLKRGDIASYLPVSKYYSNSRSKCRFKLRISGLSLQFAADVPGKRDAL
jgi:hypothetical protein